MCGYATDKAELPATPRCSAFLRNVCIAFGNTGTPEDLPALQTAASDPHELIAEFAAWAIKEIRIRHSTLTGLHKSVSPC